MPDEWPIAAPPQEERQERSSTAYPAGGERRLAAVVQDFFLADEARLTEQGRALMSAMLHHLVESIAVELRARLEPEMAAGCAADAPELIADLGRAGLIQDETLVGLLLRRADVQRLAQGGRGGRTLLQRWTADPDGDIAGAAMALVTARGRSRDRFGRTTLDLVDLPAPLAHGLVLAIAAALGTRSGKESDSALAGAAADLVRSQREERRLEELETALAEALGPDRRRSPGLLVTLADEGDSSLLAAILATEAGIPAEEAWSALLGGGERVALLLRLADVTRPEAGALLAASGPALGLGDPVLAIETFDSLSAAAVEDARSDYRLPPGYRRAARRLRRHG
ncbi:hypothetical protein [Sphingomonas sp. LHG3406-1]|uniref:hypothetical protein n=1 Tax=Sphingomonas sp. LHG3406-1 TaxID=2804617 RepID=UPI0026055080|nr:hypothetical protein [Sphingomonas sp. LHG3406-1]